MANNWIRRSPTFAPLRIGFHASGAQGLIDGLMDITSADLVIGIFRKRLGTPTLQGSPSGTAHELERAIASTESCPEAWTARGRSSIIGSAADSSRSLATCQRLGLGNGWANPRFPPRSRLAARGTWCAARGPRPRTCTGRMPVSV